MAVAESTMSDGLVFPQGSLTRCLGPRSTTWAELHAGRADARRRVGQLNAGTVQISGFDTCQILTARCLCMNSLAAAGTNRTSKR